MAGRKGVQARRRCAAALSPSRHTMIWSRRRRRSAIGNASHTAQSTSASGFATAFVEGARPTISSRSQRTQRAAGMASFSSLRRASSIPECYRGGVGTPGWRFSNAKRQTGSAAYYASVHCMRAPNVDPIVREAATASDGARRSYLAATAAADRLVVSRRDVDDCFERTRRAVHRSAIAATQPDVHENCGAGSLTIREFVHHRGDHGQRLRF